MEIRTLAYQGKVLGLLDQYLEKLTEQKVKADKIEEANAKETDPDLKRPRLDYPLKTWEELGQEDVLPASRKDIPYSDRKDGTGRPVPNIVYKVPTAGGKTYLAIASLSKIFNKYLGKRAGFVLWIVPNEAIYTQTKKQLNDRRHPYRQLLDNLSGNAVKIMEKNTPLNANDVESNLCVMLLMLQSANRKKPSRETLKIFKERGDVHGFTPEEGNQLAHRRMLADIPNLNTCNLADSQYPWMPIKDSLGNALRIIRPVVVMDEGHKAVSKLAFETLYGFNPSFVLELTATPKDILNPRPARYQNILAEVSGLELDREEMIKMPLNLDSHQNTDWKITLKAGLERLDSLDQQAKTFAANTNRYIRPIMLVQVERTGSDQRDGKHIHAEDARDWLTKTAQLDEAEVAIKTSTKNDLKSPENQDLLSKANRIRVIITKQALQEGWDCPFAYVLCSLASNSNQSAMTQLVGRILRQPQAKKTQMPLLDESYVITHHTETNKVVEGIKKGLEKDGMGDLIQSISIGDSQGHTESITTISRNPKFAKTQIFLPKVLWAANKRPRELDYEEDVLYPLDWSNLDISEFDINKDYKTADRQLRRIWLDSDRAADAPIGSPIDTRAFDCAYSTQLISDIIPNPWLARQIIGELVSTLKKKIGEEKLGKLASYINDSFREWLLKKRDEMAETRFRQAVKDGFIQFRLRTDGEIGHVNWEMPNISRTNQYEGADQLISRRGLPLQRSLFLPMYKDDMNTEERHIATYIDDVDTVNWWHRNVARNHYSLQGWRRDKIYPDFICSVNTSDEGKPKLVVLEMKGEHLAGNEDTRYKQAILELMTQSFSIEQGERVGEMELIGAGDTSIVCDLLLFTEWQQKLPTILK